MPRLGVSAVFFVLLGFEWKFVDCVWATDPRHVAVLENATVTFSCTTNRSEPIRWQRILLGEKIPTMIYNGVGFATGYDAKFDVNFQTKVRQSDLVVNRVKASDAGRYGCIEFITAAEKVYFELVIIETDPVCLTNISSQRYLVNAFDLIQVDCSLNYTGNIPPSMRCFAKSAPVVHEVNETTRSGIRHRTLILADPAAIDSSKILCLASFDLSSSTTFGGYGMKPPSYKYPWESPAIHVRREELVTEQPSAGSSAVDTDGIPSTNVLILASTVTSTLSLMTICLFVVLTMLWRRFKTRDVRNSTVEQASVVGPSSPSGSIAPRTLNNNNMSSLYLEIRDTASDASSVSDVEVMRGPYDGLEPGYALHPPVEQRPAYSRLSRDTTGYVLDDPQRPEVVLRKQNQVHRPVHLESIP